jgi:phosphate transport system permease protein
VLGTLVLIVYELVLRSGPSWHAFGFKFFSGRDWDPVSEQFGALPFIYGTLVSSILALIIAVPLSIGVAVFTTEMCPAVFRGPLSFFVERRLRIVGHFRAGADSQQLCWAVPCPNPGLDGTV